MDTMTWGMLFFYFIVIGGGSAWTMRQSLKGNAAYDQEGTAGQGMSCH